MISKWGVKNFKSILEANLDLAPLTIFTGVNSSGKSSFLHSIAMLKQSINEVKYTLSGGLVNLGEFRHIYCNKAHEYKQDMNKIDIQFTISPGDHKQIDVEQKLEIDDDDIIRLGTFSMESKINNEGNKNIYLKYSKRGMTKIDKVSLDEIKQSVQLPPLLRGNINFKKMKTYFSHSFIPNGISFFSKYTDEQIDAFIKLLVKIPSKESLLYLNVIEQNEELLDKEMTKDYLDKEIIKIDKDNYKTISDFLETIFNKLNFVISQGIKINCLDPFTPIFKKYFPINDYLSISDWYLILSKIDEKEREIIKEEITRDGGKFIKQITENDDYETPVIAFPNRIKEICKELNEYFNHKIKYLGPLREDPLWSYKSSFSEEIDVKGSNSLSYYYRNYKEYVENYISPMDIDTIDCSLKITNLAKALNEWLIYIGIASEHNISKQPDKYKTIYTPTSENEDSSLISSVKNIASGIANILTLGAYDKLKKEYNTQSIREDGDFKITLFFDGEEYAIPQLGTGVSQVLPVLVMCLTAPPDSTIIIQEPEQALHPKMQSRLADFFISMALSGRQCIIETHSEYIIEKLRYRIVKEKNENIKNKTKIYFAKKNDSKTEFEEIEINEYGAIMNWPDGFFDESLKWADDIDKAVSEKWERNNKKQ